MAELKVLPTHPDSIPEEEEDEDDSLDRDEDDGEGVEVSAAAVSLGHYRIGSGYLRQGIRWCDGVRPEPG